MKGDTIILDTIISCTGIVTKKYVFNSYNDTMKSVYKFLTPINDDGLKVDSMSLYVDEKNYR